MSMAIDQMNSYIFKSITTGFSKENRTKMIKLAVQIINQISIYSSNENIEQVIINFTQVNGIQIRQITLAYLIIRFLHLDCTWCSEHTQ